MKAVEHRTPQEAKAAAQSMLTRLITVGNWLGTTSEDLATLKSDNHFGPTVKRAIEGKFS